MTISCQACSAAIELAQGQRTARCPYCASPHVVERPTAAATPPAFAIGFGVTRSRALEVARRWKRQRGWFTHGAFRRAPVDDITGLYLPAYLYNAEIDAEFSAQIGEHYTVTYTTTVNGKRVTRTRTETEWRPLVGRWSSYVSDVIVTASRGVSNTELEAIEPYDLSGLRRFAPALISGWAAEEPSLLPAECGALAEGEVVATVDRLLAGFMPGDTHRGLTHHHALRNQSLVSVLLPLWVLPVRYRADRDPVRLLVNGQTGRVSGRAPLSWARVAVAVAAGVVAVAGAVIALHAAGILA